MALREKFGPADFNRYLERKKKKANGTTPIWEFDRNQDTDREAILYSKAPVLIHKLEQKMGKEDFVYFMSKMYTYKISTTNEFLNLLETEAGKETASYFEQKLRSV